MPLLLFGKITVKHHSCFSRNHHFNCKYSYKGAKVQIESMTKVDGISTSKLSGVGFITFFGKYYVKEALSEPEIAAQLPLCVLPGPQPQRGS